MNRFILIVSKTLYLPTKTCQPFVIPARLLVHAAEADVITCARNLALAAGSNHVPRTVLAGAQKRSPTLHMLGDTGVFRVKSTHRPLGIANHSLRRQLSIVVGAIPVTSPLPHIAR